MGGDTEDQGKVAVQAQAAFEAGLITKRSAVERIADPYGIEDVKSYLESVEKEAGEKRKQAMETAEAMAKNKPDDEGGDDKPPFGGKPVDK